MKKPELKRKSSRKIPSRKSNLPAAVPNMPAVVAKDALNISCHSCGDTNKIPLARFYDGFEGIFSCNTCQEPLDHVMESLDD